MSNENQEVQHEVQQEVVNKVQKEEPKITAEEKPREKDPKKVAAGKRLGAISKAAKEDKMRKLLQEENGTHWKRYAIISIGLGVLSFASYKYFFPAQKKVEPYEQKVQQEIPPEENKKNKKRGKPISMFD